MMDNLPDVIWASAYPYPEWARSESLIKYTVNLSGADGYAKYTRTQLKMQKVDLDTLKIQKFDLDQFASGISAGYNRAIYDIKAKHGDLYAEVKE